VIRSFEFSSIRWKCKQHEVDPSLAFVFYVNDLKSLKGLKEQIEAELSKEENPILVIEWSNVYKTESNVSIIEECENRH
jgi:hypothetical protein